MRLIACYPLGIFKKTSIEIIKAQKIEKQKKTDNAEATQSFKKLYPFKEVLVIKSKYPAQI